MIFMISHSLSSVLSNRIIFPAIVILLVKLWSCTSPPSFGSQTSPPVAIALWSEFSPLARVQEALPLLQKYSLGLFQAIHTENLTSPVYLEELYGLLSESIRLGLDTRAWILLPPQEGYWPNEENRATFFSRTEEFLSWIKGRSLPISWIGSSWIWSPHFR